MSATARATPSRTQAHPLVVVGHCGPYDVTAVAEIAIALFGTTADNDPGLWAAGNPLTHAASRPDVPVRLLHGKADDTASFTTQLADALKDGGHQVTVDLIAGADHSGIYQSDVAAARLID